MKRSTLFDFNFSGGMVKKRKDNEIADASAASSTSSDSSRPSSSTRGSDSVVEKEVLGDSGRVDSGPSQSESPAASSTKSNPKGYRFQMDWLKKWPWLKKIETGMQCKLCMKHKKQNALTTSSGSTNYRTTTLERHMESADHFRSVQAETLQKDFVQASAAADEKNRSGADEAVLAALRTVHFMATEDIPIAKYTRLMEFQKLQKAGAIDQLSVGGNATYLSRSAGMEFQEAVAAEIHGRVIGNIRDASMFSVLIDETTDISVTKHMVVYARVVDQNFSPRTYFLRNVTVDSPKSDAATLFGLLTETLQQEDLDITKAHGFGSDGAAVMVGRKNGVSALMKKANPHCVSVHCMAHRLNLATSQASKDLPFLKEVEKMLGDLYRHFGGSKSGNRKCELEHIQKVLGDPIIKVKECYEIRWLAFYDAVKAVFLSWPSLYTYFTDHSSSETRPVKKLLQQYKCVAVLATLMDILPSLSKLSLILQKSDLDIACVQPAITNLLSKLAQAKEGNGFHQQDFRDKLKIKRNSDGKVTEVKFKGKALHFEPDMKTVGDEVKEMRVAFCEKLIENINRRFPADATKVVSAFGVLAMQPLTYMSPEERKAYGETELRVLADFYGQDQISGSGAERVVSRALIDPAECLEEWAVAKESVIENKYPRDSVQRLFKLLFEYHRDTFPNLITLAQLALIMPLHTADCERGFSCQNSIKTSTRSCLKEDHLNTLMTIKCEGDSTENHDFGPALQRWKTSKNRRLLAKD